MQSQTGDRHGGNIWRASADSGLNPADIIDYSASIVPLGLSERAREAVKNSLALTAAYPDPDSIELKDAIASYHGLSAENILPGNGSTDLIYLVARVLGFKSALIVDPAFSEYRRSLKLAHVSTSSFETLEKDGFAFDVKKLAKRAQEGFDAVYIANPSSPAGVLAKKETILELADECATLGTTVVVDEAFCDFTEAESVKVAACERENLIVLRSLTKFFVLAGFRVGYVVGHKATIKKLSAGMSPWSINTLASIAAAQTLADVPYINKVLRWFDAEHSFLYRGLSAIDGITVYPSSANFFMFRVKKGEAKASALAKALYKEGILVRQLGDFKGLDDSFMRVALKERKENKLILERVKGFLDRK